MENTHKALLYDKLHKVSEYINILKKYENISIQEYLSNFETQLAMEGVIQSIIKIVIRMNCYILSYVNAEKRTTNSDEAFIELSKCGVISSELAQQLMPFTGLANHLIYEYYCIDHNRVFEAIKSTLQQYSLYVQQISNYLVSLEAH